MPPSAKKTNSPSKNATRIDVAKEAGLSPSTVTRALTDHPGIPEKTRNLVKEIASRIGYIPSLLGRSFYQKKSFCLGVVLPFEQKDEKGRKVNTIQGEYFSKLLFGLMLKANGYQYRVNLIADNGLSAEALASEVERKSCDGLLFLYSRTDDLRPKELLKRKIPFVLIHRSDLKATYPSVDINNEKGIALILEHLKSKGVKTISYIGGQTQSTNSLDREKAVKEISQTLGIEILKIVPGNFSRRSGLAAGKIILAEKKLPEAVVCANDRMAYGCVEAFKGAGKKMPDEIRVTGFDDTDIAGLSSPKLTTVINPFFEIGMAASEMLIKIIKGEKVKNVLVEPELVIRESA
jgi:DNA-binding LacI/PurR family transcriptional regulator